MRLKSSGPEGFLEKPAKPGRGDQFTRQPATPGVGIILRIIDKGQISRVRLFIQVSGLAIFVWLGVPAAVVFLGFQYCLVQES